MPSNSWYIPTSWKYCEIVWFTCVRKSWFSSQRVFCRYVYLTSAPKTFQGNHSIVQRRKEKRHFSQFSTPVASVVCFTTSGLKAMTGCGSPCCCIAENHPFRFVFVLYLILAYWDFTTTSRKIKSCEIQRLKWQMKAGRKLNNWFYTVHLGSNQGRSNSFLLYAFPFLIHWVWSTIQ